MDPEVLSSLGVVKLLRTFRFLMGVLVDKHATNLSCMCIYYLLLHYIELYKQSTEDVKYLTIPTSSLLGHFIVSSS